MDVPLTIREGVRRAYSAVAERPAAEHPFAVGREFAAGLGYPAALLDGLPRVSVEAFTGVSTVSLFAELAPGDRVLDLGCGAGLDSLIAARRVGPKGMVVGVDFSTPMLARARHGAAEGGAGNIWQSQAAAENLPLPAASIDAALVNGLINLNPARTAIFRELARVLRRGGRVYAAELILREPAPATEGLNPDDWFA